MMFDREGYTKITFRTKEKFSQKMKEFINTHIGWEIYESPDGRKIFATENDGEYCVFLKETSIIRNP